MLRSPVPIKCLRKGKKENTAKHPEKTEPKWLQKQSLRLRFLLYLEHSYSCCSASKTGETRIATGQPSSSAPSAGYAKQGEKLRVVAGAVIDIINGSAHKEPVIGVFITFFGKPFVVLIRIKCCFVCDFRREFFIDIHIVISAVTGYPEIRT